MTSYDFWLAGQLERYDSTAVAAESDDVDLEDES